MTYSSSGIARYTEEEKTKVVEEYMPKLKVWVLRAKGFLPDGVDIDELYSAASLGLIECLDKFDKSRNVAFGTYVEHRVKGAILDALRGLDILSRTARSKVKQLDGAVNELKQSLGRTPTVAEIAEALSIDEDEVYKIYDLQTADKPLSLDDGAGYEDGFSLIDFLHGDILSPEDEVINRDVTTHLADEIDKLPERERLVVSLYYYEELTMKEIAEVMDITESRVSQIHSAAVQKMKKRLKGFI